MMQNATWIFFGSTNIFIVSIRSSSFVLKVMHMTHARSCIEM